MKKKLLLILAIILGAGLLYFNSNTEIELEKEREEFAKLVNEHPFNKTMHLSKKERKSKGLPPNAYFEQEYLNQINPATGRTHPENIFQIQEKLSSERILRRVPGDEANNPWVERGPNNVGGRTRAVLFDPNDATHKRVFAGGVSGGLWVNNDITSEETSWQQVGISENLAITCITVDPNNSQILYVGTGESHTSNNGDGTGVWKSTDGGNSWFNVFNDTSSSLTRRIFFINDILAWNNPTTNKTEVFIGVGGSYYASSAQNLGSFKTGLYKSTDDAANWTKLTVDTPSFNSYEPNDFEVGADNTIWVGTKRNRLNSGGGTVLKSTDGTNFTVAFTIAGSNNYRTEISVSKQDPKKVFVLAETRTFSGGQAVAPFLSFFKTEDSFATTTDMTLPKDADTGIPEEDFTRGQAFYDLVIETDPTNDNILYVGGIDLFRSANAGTSWKQISKWSDNNNLARKKIPPVHADQHGFAFHPTDSDKAIIGNDGGVYYASSLEEAGEIHIPNNFIAARNKDYNTLQFYDGAIGQNIASDVIMAGAQDNGTPFINGAVNNAANPSVDVYGGDGAYTFIDKDGEYMIASYVFNVKGRINLPYTGASTDLDSDQDSGSFINPQELDDNLDILYSNAHSGSENAIRRYKGIKVGETLEKDDLKNTLLTGRATELKISPFTTASSTLFVGLFNGALLKVTNTNFANPTWTSLNTPVTGAISAVNFGNNENEIFLTYHNYGIKSIWYTADGGANWQDKEGDFPDIPVKDIMMNPLNNDQVIIATELGIWTTGNIKATSPKWVQAQNGMSNVKVNSLSLRTADNTVLAATYGRGMFTGKFTAAVASVDQVLSGAKAFTIYPTISNGNFTIQATNELGNTKMNIFDIAGRQVYQTKVDFKSNTKQSISTNLNAGVYIVNLVDENNKKSSQKIIIE
ncbi:MAG: T9SS type A sorting domain-containing protein [Polaribacter sp.]